MSKTNESNSVAKGEGDVKASKTVDVTAVRDLKSSHVQRVVLNKERLASLGLSWVESQGFVVLGGQFDRGPSLVFEVEMDAAPSGRVTS